MIQDICIGDIEECTKPIEHAIWQFWGSLPKLVRVYYSENRPFLLTEDEEMTRMILGCRSGAGYDVERGKPPS